MEYPNEIETLIQRYLSGEISSDQLRTLESWLEEEGAHREYFEQMQNIWDAAAPVFPFESISLKKGWNTVRKHIHARPSRLRLLVGWWQKAAALLILPLAGVLAYLLFTGDTGGKESFLTVHCPYGSQIEIALPDGSAVWLNSGSSLKYPAVFKEKERNVYLRGEGYFDVSADLSHPFIVHTGEAQVKALGTAFNIEAYPEENIHTFTLVRGKIDISWNELKQTTPMKPNEIAEYDRIERSLRKETVEDTYRWYAWKDGTLIFKDEPLEQVVRRLNIVYHADITVTDPELASYPYRATFRNKPLADILELLKLSAPIRIDTVDSPEEAKHIYKKTKLTIRKIAANPKN